MNADEQMPRVLGRLGISERECERHIVWDIGIAGVSRLMADALDATLVQQNYSRLLIDCNRRPDIDFGDQRAHWDTGKHRPERRPESRARAGDFPALS